MDYETFENRYEIVKALNKGIIKREYMPIVSYKETDVLQTFIESLSEISVKKIQKYLKINQSKLNINFDFKTFIENEIPYLYLKKANKEKDQIKTSIIKKSSNELKPIQNELFLNKIILNIIKYGIPSKQNFITKRTLIISSNNYILDGHHRWLTTMLFKPELELEMLKIKMRFEELYPILLAYNTPSKINY